MVCARSALTTMAVTMSAKPHTTDRMARYVTLELLPLRATSRGVVVSAGGGSRWGGGG